MSGDLESGVRQRLVESNKQFADPEQREDKTREMDAQKDPSDRLDFYFLMTSVVILAIGIVWVTPW